jgi:homoaconitate hydratase family protein
MGRTFVEKILGAKSDNPHPKVGQIVNAIPDMLICDSGSTAIAIRHAKEIGIRDSFDPEKIAIILDHFIPAESAQSANNHKIIREFVREYDIDGFFDVNKGVCHQIAMEHSYILPGTLILGKDSHAPSYGALSAFGAGIGVTEMGCAIATGKLWLKVPESIKIIINGKPRKGVYAKDIALMVMNKVRSDGASYCSVEFSGETIEAMSISERFTLSNLSSEMGAKCSYIPYDNKTEEYLHNHQNIHPYTPVYPDNDAEYIAEYHFDCSELEPLVACPHQVDNIKAIWECEGIEVHQAFLGSCSNGRIDDLVIAESILRGKQVNPKTRLLVTPASVTIYQEAIQRGLISSLIDSGAMILNPGCSACFGGHQGVMADGERCISSSNRNFQGRMGNVKSEIYLGSPAMVAASALEGKLVDPRKYI